MSDSDKTKKGVESDRKYLNGLIDLYLEALVAHDPSRLPLARDVRFAENGQELELGDALWGTASGLGTYKVYFTDETSGQVGFFGVIKEKNQPVILVLRLKAEIGRITEIETIVA